MFAHPFIDALVGGVLIGVAASAMLLLNGRICGVSGIVGGLAGPTWTDPRRRVSFSLGLLVGGAVMLAFRPAWMPVELDTPIALAAAAGLIVGFGTRLGGGCTSGHGVCGVGRLSMRSISATVVFVTTGALTVLVSRWIAGGTG